jgi:uncharacterized protein YfaS (alpha-2-macroglobulin family)
VTEELQSYIYAYTSGVISKMDPIRVRFTQPGVSTEEVGQTLSDLPISFSPSIEGTVYWEDEHTLLLQPSSPMRSNTEYTATVKMNQIFANLPRNARVFDFSFMTRELFFDVVTEGLHSPDPNNLKKQELRGVLITSDITEAEATEQLLTATQNNNDLKVEWSHDNDQLNHRFTVAGIQRDEKGGEVRLSWNGQALNIDHKGSKIVAIPSLSNFKIMDARVFQHPEQYINLYFSDPLATQQTLNGLVQIENYNGDLRFNIDGNQLLIYPDSRITGTRKVTVLAGIKNSQQKGMDKNSEWKLTFEEEKPQVRLVGQGVILPNSEGLIFPFEAVNLNAVEVEVFKIFNNNILQFLQTNDIDYSYDNYELTRVGRIVMQKKIDLKSLNPEASLAQWTRYALDLSSLIKQDPASIYQIRIGFRPGYSDYYCSDNTIIERSANQFSEADRTDDLGAFQSIYNGYYGVNGWYDGYRWDQRDDPCYPAYYNNDHFVSRNVIASDIGLVAKKGKDKSMLFIATDLRTAAPLSGVTIEVYDYQQQRMQQLTTGSNGMVETRIDGDPFVAIAKNGGQSGYLKLKGGSSLSVSRFDVAGAVPQKGLKGYTYAERGVWRPGDSIYLHFILEDEGNKIPDDYPVQFELVDARGQIAENRTSSYHLDGVYPFHTATAMDAPTGNWLSRIKVGGAVFTKTLKVETVKPNRLKIKLDFGQEVLVKSNQPAQAQLQVNWLHGAPAGNLKAKVEMQVNTTNTSFEKYPDFEFDDPARRFYSRPSTIFDGMLDGDGKATISKQLVGDVKAPGKLVLEFKTRAFEKGGDFSADQFSLPYHLYPAYSGVYIPRNQYGSKRIEMNTTGQLEFALVDTEGRPLKNRKLQVGLYRVSWRWWWDRNEGNLSDYNTSSHFNAEEKATITTDNEGKAAWDVKIDNWGRYMVRVCDEEGGHCSGDFFYAGYPWYNDSEFNRKEAAMMAFTSTKEKYNVGETIELKVPATADSRVLVTLENGTKVVESYWEEAKEGDNTFTFKATADMAPTIYAHVALIQPHAQVKNDLPIRMYGVIPIGVEDPTTILKPQLKMPEELEPESTVEIEVAEETGREMVYTVAMVDEGLLDLTRFKTPNPWDAFYAREALGVQTFDVYDQVLGAYGGQLERLLSIGGDGEVLPEPDQDGVNRFKPVVRHLGPFRLKKGGKAKHQIQIPNYVGSVRTMVVAAEAGAYGSTEKTTPVRKPVMVLATLPRVLSPTESLNLPVAVFASEKGIQNVEVSVKESSGLVSFEGPSTQNVAFDKPGEQMAYFRFKVNEGVGIAKFTVNARGGSHSASQEIELEVRNPNPFVTEVVRTVLDPNESWETAIRTVGMAGTNTAILEVSNIPPIDLGRRLEYLIRYPYGCLEQTLSSGFPQLYVDQLIELNDSQKEQVPRNIKATIKRLSNFQRNDGGFSYWPGGNYINQWSTTYAGHFLLEARELGYNVPGSTLDPWIKSQRTLARSWSAEQSEQGFYNRSSNQLSQAYRLYTLALAGKPEMGAMNSLRSIDKLDTRVRWRLAAAYALAGQQEVANELVKNQSMEVEDYREMSGTFGTAIRDKAMILETLIALDRKEDALEVAKTISEELSSSRWLGTQTTAYCLLSIGKLVNKYEFSKKLEFEYAVGNERGTNAGTSSPIMQLELPGETAQALTVKNTSGGIMYARLILRGKPVIGDPVSNSSNLNMEVAFKTIDGKALDPSRIEQGTDFVAEFKVTHPGVPYTFRYDELALSAVFPSGWEIINTRMDNMQYFNNASRYEYQDFRDDRVDIFFDLYNKKSHVYYVRLNAAYQGRYYLPTINCEAMYDNRIYAQSAGQWIEVVEQGLQ